jgi:hypothetical protein
MSSSCKACGFCGEVLASGYANKDGIIFEYNFKGHVFTRNLEIVMSAAEKDNVKIEKDFKLAKDQFMADLIPLLTEKTQDGRTKIAFASTVALQQKSDGALILYIKAMDCFEELYRNLVGHYLIHCLSLAS